MVEKGKIKRWKIATFHFHSKVETIKPFVNSILIFYLCTVLTSVFCYIDKDQAKIFFASRPSRLVTLYCISGSAAY